MKGLLPLLLLLYPPSFRRRYGRDIRQALESSLELLRGQPLGRIRGVLRATADLLSGCVVAWIDVGRGRATRSSGKGGRMKMWTEMRSSARLVARRLVGSPWVSAVVVATLALGIGANAAVFSLVDGVLLRPLPYDRPGNLVFVWSDLTELGIPFASINGGQARDLQEESTMFSDFVPMRNRDVSLSGGTLEAARPVNVATVGSGFFDALRVDPMIGRGLLPEEQGPAAAPVAVLSHRLWSSAFGGDQNAVGKDVMVDGAPYRVVGVMPADFRFRMHQGLGDPVGPDLYVPLTEDLAEHGPDYGFSFTLLGRIGDDVPHERAFAELDQLASRLGERDWDRPGFRFTPVYLSDGLLAKARPVLGLLMAGSLAVLLIVCSNVATVLLARGVSRRKDRAVELALGATRGRLVRATLIESVLLSILGAVAGLGLAHLAVRLLLSRAPGDLPRVEEVAVDLRVVLATFGVALLVALVTSLAPALLFRGAGSLSALRGTRGSTVGRRAQRGLRGLVAIQVALSTALLASVALIGKSMARLFEVDAGFRAGEQVTFTIRVGNPDSEISQVVAFYEALTQGLLAEPGVHSVGMVSGLPLSARASQRGLDFSGTPGATGAEGEDQVLVDRMIATPGYAAAAGLEVLDGRWFESGDERSDARVTVIDHLLAERFWPGRSPVGTRIGGESVGAPEGLQIIGVVRQPRLYDLGADDRPQWWVAQSFAPQRQMSVVIEGDLSTQQAVAAAVREVGRLDPAVAVAEVGTMSDLVSTALSRWRYAVLIMGCFGAAALLLAVLGVYGVVAYSVARRTQELGIRMALGARSQGIARLVLRQGLGLVAGGLALGIAGAWASSRVLSSFLYQVSPRDPGAVVAVAGVLLVSVLAATLVPARRAMRIPPSTAFRTE